jgi:hypothetical protein
LTKRGQKGEETATLRCHSGTRCCSKNYSGLDFWPMVFACLPVRFHRDMCLEGKKSREDNRMPTALLSNVEND